MTSRWKKQGKAWANRMLRAFHLRVETLTVEEAETQRLRYLLENSYFDERAFPLPISVNARSVDEIISSLSRHEADIGRLLDPQSNSTGFEKDNLFYSGPDAEILYAMIRLHQPGRIVEVGSGHSTRVLRQAVIDGGLETELVAVDPKPRIDVSRLVDRMHRTPVGMLTDLQLFQDLRENDILFVDSSHEIKIGNDVVFLYLRVLPSLRPGVLVHLHDIFLPFEYPAEWILGKKRPWTEQYLLQAILSAGNSFEIVWPGYFLQRTRQDFRSLFHSTHADASSFWLRKQAAERAS